MTEPFAPWYVEGKPMPVMHPIPWVYAEIYFPSPDSIQWCLYNYATGEYQVETFTFSEKEEGDIPPEYKATSETSTGGEFLFDQ